MCGEYILMELLANPNMGSPPHVWGILHLSKNIFIFIRITPTCVGNTGEYFALRIQGQDHPHMCGEYFVYNLRIRRV